MSQPHPDPLQLIHLLPDDLVKPILAFVQARPTDQPGEFLALVEVGLRYACAVYEDDEMRACCPFCNGGAHADEETGDRLGFEWPNELKDHLTGAHLEQCSIFQAAVSLAVHRHHLHPRPHHH